MVIPLGLFRSWRNQFSIVAFILPRDQSPVTVDNSKSVICSLSKTAPTMLCGARGIVKPPHFRLFSRFSKHSFFRIVKFYYAQPRASGAVRVYRFSNLAVFGKFPTLYKRQKKCRGIIEVGGKLLDP